MRAVGMLSGGLDSTLAARLVADMGVQVEGVRFDTGFGREDYSAALPAVEAHNVDVAREYFERVVMAPRYGFGAAMNPCIDCRIFMLRRADEMARSRGAKLLLTGEIIGQSAWTQSRSALLKIEREAGLEGRLLRPLCAHHLEATAAERRGEIDRTKLGRLGGRSRRPQYDMAAKLGIKSFPTPSGGCCWLARQPFGRRLRDRIAHGGRAPMATEEIEMLKRGRHFRVSWNLKVILGRNLQESEWLAARAGERWSCQVADGHGSFALLQGDGDPAGLLKAAGLAARYSGHRTSASVRVVLRRGDEARRIRSAPTAEEVLAGWRI